MSASPPPPEETAYKEGIEVEVDETDEGYQEIPQTNEESIEQQSNPAEMETDSDNGHLDPPFIHGLCVGLGIGCIAAFAIMWCVIFFTPLVPSAMTYESLLAIFIYPLIYLLAIGLVALTAGIVRQYYSSKDIA
jgi:hypothetical protein